MEPNEEQLKIIGNGRHRNTIDSDEEEEALLQQMRETKIKQTISPQQNTNKKRVPDNSILNPQKEIVQMEIQGKNIHKLKFHQLGEEILFYLTDIYPYGGFGGKLYISGVLQSGQTIGIIATEPQKQLYFCLKSESSDADIISQAFKQKAKRQINQRLQQCGINKFTSQFQQKEYVFEIDGMPRNKRQYYKVRYPFKHQCKDQPKPDWEGDTYKYVFGTTYTPLQLFIINSGIKGPAWVKVQKQYLSQNTKNTDGVLCAQIQDAQLIEPVNQMNKPPNMRVMSISIKTAIPSQVKLKKLFNTNRVDDLHIYAISYFLCEDYLIEVKPNKYNGISKTFFLKQFGAQTREKQFIVCDNQKQMIAQFQADLRKYDPDMIVCHDASRILDTLIQRLIRISDKNDRPRLGRLIYSHQLNKSNQLQRINSSIAGRLLVDTYAHSKDMIKSVDYQLQSMAAHIRPQKVFKGMSQEDTLQFLNDNKTMFVIRKAKQQAQCTFALMNHLQILQITRQLSNICGNIWKRSLQNQRAERNQYLIMHDCAKRNLIIPDKFRKDKNADQDQDVDRKKYQGGHVIDPLKGFYKDFILLLDFNSLYPSIIRQYNVCFSVIERPKLPLSYYYKSKDKVNQKKLKELRQEAQQNEEIQVVPPPKEECTKEKWGFLPQLIDKIVDRRKRCKKAMKGASAQKCVILDIQQKCYKLVANSIYGCLGFSISRFYSKHLAALITRMGREALLRAKDIVGIMGGVKVIYGDTDSLMIQPIGLQKQDDRQKLFEIKNIAQQLKKNINKEYSNLQIDVDGIFKPLILLMKKKYVARKLTNYDRVIAGFDQTLNYNIQYKGIEVVRRDGFELARSFLRRTLEILMNSTKSQPTETYEQIYAYAKQMNQKFPTINYKQFLFSKQLNKTPKEYARGQTIPHVKVAMDRIKAGQREQTLVNHTIYYIVCKAKDKSQDSLAKLCYDDRAYERSQKFFDEKGPLQYDDEYYKRELLQPVGRIIQHLQDFSIQRYLQEIGLSDQGRKKFKRQLQSEREQGEIILDGCISHDNIQKSKKFAQTIGQLQCVCGQKTMIADKGKLLLYCPNPSCNKGLGASIYNKIVYYIKQKLSEYYMNHFKCRCSKQYNLNPLIDCCKIKYKPRSSIPFEIHELIYVTKDLCNISIKEHGQQQKDVNVISKIKSLEKKLDLFLEQSDFEKVSGLLNVLKL